MDRRRLSSKNNNDFMPRVLLFSKTALHNESTVKKISHVPAQEQHGWVKTMIIAHQKMEKLNWMLEKMPVEIRRRCKRISVKPNHVIIRHGDTLQVVYILLSGLVQISHSTPDGKLKRVVYVTPGYTIGEMEALAQTECNEMVFSAVAFEHSEMFSIPKADFLQWLAEDHEIALYICRCLADKMLVAALEIGEHTPKPGIVRVMEYLLYSTRDGARERRINHTRAEIAESCGIGIRTVNRAISTLKKLRLLTINSGKICIDSDNRQQLEAFIEESMIDNNA